MLVSNSLPFKSSLVWFGMGHTAAHWQGTNWSWWGLLGSTLMEGTKRTWRSWRTVRCCCNLEDLRGSSTGDSAWYYSSFVSSESCWISCCQQYLNNFRPVCKLRPQTKRHSFYVNQCKLWVENIRKKYYLDVISLWIYCDAEHDPQKNIFWSIILLQSPSGVVLSGLSWWMLTAEKLSY